MILQGQPVGGNRAARSAGPNSQQQKAREAQENTMNAMRGSHASSGQASGDPESAEDEDAEVEASPG